MCQLVIQNVVREVIMCVCNDLQKRKERKEEGQEHFMG
jgi:hypothetical protein